MSDDDSKYEAIIMQRETDRLRITSQERLQLAKERTARIVTCAAGVVALIFIGAIFGFWAYTVHVPDAKAIQPGTTLTCEVVEGS